MRYFFMHVLQSLLSTLVAGKWVILFEICNHVEICEQNQHFSSNYNGKICIAQRGCSWMHKFTIVREARISSFFIRVFF